MTLQSPRGGGKIPPWATASGRSFSSRRACSAAYRPVRSAGSRGAAPALSAIALLWCLGRLSPSASCEATQSRLVRQAEQAADSTLMGPDRAPPGMGFPVLGSGFREALGHGDAPTPEPVCEDRPVWKGPNVSNSPPGGDLFSRRMCHFGDSAFGLCCRRVGRSEEAVARSSWAGGSPCSWLTRGPWRDRSVPSRHSRGTPGPIVTRPSTRPQPRVLVPTSDLTGQAPGPAPQALDPAPEPTDVVTWAVF